MLWHIPIEPWRLLCILNFKLRIVNFNLIIINFRWKRHFVKMVSHNNCRQTPRDAAGRRLQSFKSSTDKRIEPEDYWKAMFSRFDNFRTNHVLQLAPVKCQELLHSSRWLISASEVCDDIVEITMSAGKCHDAEDERLNSRVTLCPIQYYSACDKFCFSFFSFI